MEIEKEDPTQKPSPIPRTRPSPAPTRRPTSFPSARAQQPARPRPSPPPFSPAPAQHHGPERPAHPARCASPASCRSRTRARPATDKSGPRVSARGRTTRSPARASPAPTAWPLPSAQCFPPHLHALSLAATLAHALALHLHSTLTVPLCG